GLKTQDPSPTTGEKGIKVSPTHPAIQDTIPVVGETSPGVAPVPREPSAGTAVLPEVEVPLCGITNIGEK
ncbi:hypothetical protein NDU88_002831, partial [Pleurodeles waltl]